MKSECFFESVRKLICHLGFPKRRELSQVRGSGEGSGSAGEVVRHEGENACP